MERYRDEIVSTDGFGEKSFESLQKSIEKSKECTLAKFIASIGIPQVGRHVGRDKAFKERFPSEIYECVFDGLLLQYFYFVWGNNFCLHQVTVLFTFELYNAVWSGIGYV